VSTRLALVGVAVTAALALVAPALAATPLRVETSISPSFPVFADTITARVDVDVDRDKVDQRSVRIEESFGGWRQEGDAVTSTASAGSMAIHSWRSTLTCLDLVCLPGAEPRAVHFPAAVVTARSRGGAPLTARGEWPEFSIAARVPPASAPDAPFELQTALPEATYRVSPTSLALALDAFAALLVVVAIALVVPVIAGRQRARRPVGDDRSPLARALAYVREAKGRRADDRRRAVGLLARTLGRESNGLDAVASRVAWSADEPSPAGMEELARAVEAERRERT
jgi:hypothetical protein